MHQFTTLRACSKVVLGFLAALAFTACGGDPHDPVANHQEPLSPTSSPDASTNEGETGTEPTGCHDVECPPPPLDWCTSGDNYVGLPQWLIEYWNSTCDEAMCGNGILDEGELCDDGNSVSADGCPADCSAVEAGFECSIPGQPCYE